MAKNFVQPGKMINAAVSSPTVPPPVSGDPVRVGKIIGVAITAESAGGNASGETSIATEGVFNLLVRGTDGSSSVVAVGDKIYYVDANTPKLSKTTAAGHLFGKALGTVSGNTNATIPVLLIQA